MKNNVIMELSIIVPSVLPLFLILIAVMAFMYASVGHGGASGYLAMLALFAVQPSFMKPSALILNVFVSLISFIQYYRGGHFRWPLFWPFALTSIPASYLGATLSVSEVLYKKILGICLIIAILRLMGAFGRESDEIKKLPLVYGLAIGATIGFVSGMIGIGGGILLSPVILFFHWGTMKQTAAVSALFIWVNSIAGLMALLATGFKPAPEMYLWLGAAVGGGFLGAYFGSNKFDSNLLRYFLAAGLCIASLKLLFV